MKIFQLLPLFCACMFSAQSYRFIYEAKSTPDSANREKTEMKTVYLDVNSKKSIFYDEVTARRDSIYREINKRKMNNPNMMNFNISFGGKTEGYLVEKDRETGVVKYIDQIGGKAYYYEEDRPMQWKILPDTLSIGGYFCQKAETDFAGRKWFAWFTMDVPLTDGPYKFGGLPGLTVKAEDSKGDYSFDLMETKTLPAILDLQLGDSPIKVSREAFKKHADQFRKSPGDFMFNDIPAGMDMKFRMSMNGEPEREVGINELKRAANKDAEEEMKKNNNPLELN